MPLRSCSISRFLTLELLTLTVSELPTSAAGPPAPCTSVVVPNVLPLSTMMESLLPFPSDTLTLAGMLSFPSSTAAGPPPVWEIESVANELLSTVAVRAALIVPGVICV